MSYEEFLAMADEDIRAEWVAGEAMILSPASNKHQDLAAFLTSLMRVYAEAHELGEVRPAPFQTKLGPDLPGREPDVLFISREHLDRLCNTHLDGPADLAVEIVSPDSRQRDRVEKFAEYETAGVREYWLIDPAVKQAEFFHLDGGRYRPAPLDDEGRFTSVVLEGLWIEIDWLWQNPLPRLLDVLRAWKLV